MGTIDVNNDRGDRQGIEKRVSASLELRSAVIVVISPVQVLVVRNMEPGIDKYVHRRSPKAPTKNAANRTQPSIKRKTFIARACAIKQQHPRQPCSPLQRASRSPRSCAEASPRRKRRRSIASHSQPSPTWEPAYWPVVWRACPAYLVSQCRFIRSVDSIYLLDE